MKQIEDLQKRWQDSARLRGLQAAMSLEKRGLVLGAGTVLARAFDDQATRQVEASGGRPVRWYFAEEPALEFARSLFSQHEYLRRIELYYAPPPGGHR